MEVDSCGKHGSAGILSVMMPPPPPQNLTPTVSSPTVVNLSWDAVSFVSGYGISFRHFDPNSGWTGWTVSQVFLTTTGATVSNLQAGTLYEFRVRAKGDGNEYDNTWGPWSGSEQITTPTS